MTNQARQLRYIYWAWMDDIIIYVYILYVIPYGVTVIHRYASYAYIIYIIYIWYIWYISACITTTPNGTINLGQLWLRQWLVAWMAPSQHLNQCWLIIKSTHRHSFQWSFNRIVTSFIQQNTFDNIVCKNYRFCSGRSLFTRKKTLCDGCSDIMLDIKYLLMQTLNQIHKLYRREKTSPKTAWSCE